ncbi:MAG TPA: App1 family protein [Dokdonella sp.]|uniref:App1 family protein n=1 Tax=Dokdonella sp. TaxID=2291710 RepID=UPI0025BF73CC|nr:App1 family protein [Dokdonella sp.]MBX3691519.1 App1 family protein [Dokdonella sp.]MCW5566776.1 App1 family protein [Dokdonella sp.]HNR90986.1 App1 family protein [Dokdonella sp.]
MTRIIAFVGLLALATPLCAAPLKLDEEVLLVPTVARDAGDGRIIVPVDAWVHEHEPRRGAMALFARYLALDLDELPAEERARFTARTQLFRVDSERGKVLRVGFADGREATLPRTRGDGRSRAEVEIDAALVDARGRIEYEVLMPPGDARRLAGRVLHVPAEGLSIVSDIDDTIKHSQVRDRRELLLNTFLRRFIAAPGMAARYRELAATPSTRFHYVSASPLQLLPALDTFLAEAGFPVGSLHLRETTSLTRLWRSDSRAHKHAAIESLLRDFPRRRFVLVGDSGEADPEIYADLARAHAQQIAAIAIRDVSGEGADAERYRTTFAGLDRDLWQVFTTADEWRIEAAAD